MSSNFSPTLLVSLYRAQTLQHPNCCYVPCNYQPNFTQQFMCTGMRPFLPLTQTPVWNKRLKVLIHITYFLPLSITEEILYNCQRSLIHTELKKTKKRSHAQHASGKASKPKLTGTSEPSQSSVVLLAIPNEESCHGAEFRHTHRQFWHGFVSLCVK